MATKVITTEMHENFKFATGVLKGRALNSVGLPYRIIRRDDENVALFSNGNMARFYCDEPGLQPEIDVAVPPYVAGNGREVSLPGEPQKNFNQLLTEQNSPELAAAVLAADPPVPEIRRTIAVYKTRDGLRAQHLCEPVYCVLENFHVISNVDRQTVGTGLREYLWLYKQLRDMGRSRLVAAYEAFDLYAL